MGRIYGHFYPHDTSAGMRVLLIVLLAVLANLAVKVIHRASDWILRRSHAPKGALR